MKRKQNTMEEFSFLLLHILDPIYDWRLIMNSIINCSTRDNKYPNTKELFYENSVYIFFESLLV
jgi:hypothetical protein